MIAQLVFDSLAFLQNQKRLKVYACVLMETHIHLIVAAENLSKELANFKSFTARQSIDYYVAQHDQFTLRQLALHKLAHKVDRAYQFWQEGNHPIRLQHEAVLRQKMEYIHCNPVRRGYVSEPEQYRYSSARNYAGLDAVMEICRAW